MPSGFLPGTFHRFGSEVVHRLIVHHRENARVLPWRTLPVPGARARAGAAHDDPYVVLLSEVMLQQTQAPRVAELLPGFLARFPDITKLAVASRAEVLRAWRGLGYNRRGMRLHELAQLIVRDHGGRIPEDPELLQRLPGIGSYTASALACFAFGRDGAVVDTNVVRVLSRVFFRCHSRSARIPLATVHRLDAALVPQGMGAPWHEALMDHGATVCTSRDPRCGNCHLRDLCLSADLPVRAFFDRAQLRAVEPSIGGVPRRLLRGRILDLLRRQHGAQLLGELIDDLVRSLTDDSVLARVELRSLVATMSAEGLVAVGGTVAEGAEPSDAATVRLGSTE